MKKLLLFYALFSNFVFAEGVAIHPATNFDNDLKYEGYYEFKEIKISNYYELDSVIGLNINDDKIEDFLILLVPKPIIPPLSDDFDFTKNKFYRRIIVEIIGCENGYSVGNTYFNLVSNTAGLGSGFNGMSIANDEIVIEHTKPNGNVYWNIQMHFHYKNKKLCLFKIVSENHKNELIVDTYDDVAASNICISDFWE